MASGGNRKGAGRPPSGLNRKKFIIYVTDEEQESIKNLVKSMRTDLGVQKIIELSTPKLNENKICTPKLKTSTLKSKPSIWLEISLENIVKLHDSGMSHRMIAEAFNDKGIPSASGGEWTSKSVQHRVLRSKK